MAVGEWERVGNFEGESFVALICGIEQGKKKIIDGDGLREAKHSR